MHKQRVGWPRACRALDTAPERVRCNSFVKGHARPHVIRKQVICMRCKLLDDAQPSHFKINSSSGNHQATTYVGESESDNGPLAMINRM